MELDDECDSYLEGMQRTAQRANTPVASATSAMHRWLHNNNERETASRILLWSISSRFHSIVAGLTSLHLLDLWPDSSAAAVVSITGQMVSSVKHEVLNAELWTGLVLLVIVVCKMTIGKKNPFINSATVWAPTVPVPSLDEGGGRR